MGHLLFRDCKENFSGVLTPFVLKIFLMKSLIPFNKFPNDVIHPPPILRSLAVKALIIVPHSSSRISVGIREQLQQWGTLGSVSGWKDADA